MDDKQIMIDNVDVSECEFFEECEIKIDDSECLAHSRHYYEGTFYDCCDEHPDCYYKQLKHKEKECFELANVYHYLVKIANNRLNKIKDLQQQFDQLKTKNEGFKRRITKIFACLIKANRTNKIVDTIWVDNITTLWDYIALTLGIEGDQVQIEKQILQKNEVLNGTNP